ncbi:F-box/kelch-repeat protein At3g23880-like [Vicia villosa]|uniref:F-box/kelch-repeat protein At3g23880-like n=1 Tax=Vicia villosa TaxID=3911 RepID=UPI00273B69F3|nr:F-box/kelch-repeat protein At3g23880-like [Vicia villosa]
MTFLFPAIPCGEINAPSPVTLPEELIVQILSLLTVQSLTRLKCVSKSWNSLISDPFFINMHLKKSSRVPHIMICLRYLSTGSIINLLNPFHIHRKPSINTFTFPFDSKYDYAIIGSCNGIICFVENFRYYREFHLLLWNPATRFFSKTLCSFPYSEQTLNSKIEFSFGYDNVSHKYKMVAIAPRDELSVFTIGDYVWRNIQTFLTDSYHFTPMHRSRGISCGVYVSNSLNWFALHNDINSSYFPPRNFTVDELVIISLDLGTETYTQFRLKFIQDFDEVVVVEPNICVLLECLCFSHYSSKGYNFFVWQMKEFGVEESWMKLLKFDCYKYNLLHVYVICYGIVNFLPLHAFENGDMLIMVMERQQLILYSRRNNKIIMLDAVCDRIPWFNLNPYVESLVSIG